jgi:hypothetical protein
MRVLVVDDEGIIADTVTLILKHSGFEALAVYREKSIASLLPETNRPLAFPMHNRGGNALEASMPIVPRSRYISPRLSLVILSQLSVCALMLGFGCRPVPAQRTQGAPAWISAGDRQARQFDNLEDEISPRERMSGPDVRRPLATCTLRPYPGSSPTVSVRSLGVQDEYEKACDALKSQKLAESEKHLRKALQRSSLDAFGWVMLGKVLELMERLDEAGNACAEAVLHDPSYWPATVCLAEIDGKKEKWRDSLEESDRAVSLSPDSKRAAYYISAVALCNLNNMQDAESRALEAEQLDRAHEVLPLRLLLAQIDEVKGDWQGAVAQLRDCLTYASKSPEGKLAKQELARLGLLLWRDPHSGPG